MTMLPASPRKSIQSIHLWFPNMFEFKGGIQTYLIDFLSVLSKRTDGLKISVFDKLDRPGSQRDVPEVISFQFSGHIPKVFQTIYFSLQLFLSGIFRKPDLIICGHVNFSPVAYLVSRLRNVPYWILVYGVDAWGVHSPIQKKAMKGADKIVSIGTFTRDRIIEEQGIDLEKFSLLPVTFDSERFTPSPKPNYLLNRYGLKPEQPVILTVARLSEADGYKGYDKIVSALPSITKVLPNVHYLIVGKGDDRARLERLIEELNVQEFVTLAGFIPDSELVDHYNLCDVFAMPSKGEGFGIVYLEALACGKPVLGGDRDGAIDALCFGDLGVLVDPDSVEAISDALSSILQGTYQNPILYNPSELRKQAIDIFGFDQFAHKLNTLVPIIQSS